MSDRRPTAVEAAPCARLATGPRLTALDPAGYRRAPWKNGAGLSIDIADERRSDGPPSRSAEHSLRTETAAEGAWEATLWRLGRTTITAAGPFSDFSDYHRVQVVVAGRGLVLETPAGELDLREPWRPVSFDGGIAIRSRLEAGPVDVVNLIGDRRRVAIALTVLEATGAARLRPGTHVLYAPAEAAAVEVPGTRHAIAAGHALRVECDDEVMLHGLAGRLVIGSVTAR